MEFITASYLRTYTFLPGSKAEKMPKLIFVFAPGAWHPANSFDNVTTILTEQGYECHSIAFPSATRARDKRCAVDGGHHYYPKCYRAACRCRSGYHSVVPRCSGWKGLTRVDRQEKGFDGEWAIYSSSVRFLATWETAW